MITSKIMDDLHPNKGRKRECKGKLDDHPCLQDRGFSSFDVAKLELVKARAREREREREKERKRETEEQRWCQKVVHRGRMERQRRKHLLRE